jgi:uncharacterized protein (DUF3084 family)
MQSTVSRRRQLKNREVYITNKETELASREQRIEEKEAEMTRREMCIQENEQRVLDWSIALCNLDKSSLKMTTNEQELATIEARIKLFEERFLFDFS